MNAWHTQPAATDLFAQAHADMLSSGPSWEFPYSLEAELEALCDFAYLDGGEDPVTAWDLYLNDVALNAGLLS